MSNCCGCGINNIFNGVISSIIKKDDGLPALPPELIVSPELVYEYYCGEVSQAGADEPEAFMVDISKTVGVMTFRWITYGMQDRVRLYMDDNMFFDTGCGGNFDIGFDNPYMKDYKIIWDALPARPYPEYPLSEVTGFGLGIDDVANEYSFYVPRDAKRLWIEVLPNCKLGIARPSSAPGSELIDLNSTGTAWEFTTICPDGNRIAEDSVLLEKYKTDPLNIDDLRPNWTYNLYRGVQETSLT